MNCTQTTQRSRLLSQQQQQQNMIKQMLVTSTLQSTVANSDAITLQLQSQLVQVKNQRYVPYQPYIPTVVPESVMQLQMATANVGVPMSVFTIANCKGSQFVTK